MALLAQLKCMMFMAATNGDFPGTICCHGTTATIMRIEPT